MADSRAVASNDNEMGECVLEDWREQVKQKQYLPLNWGPWYDNRGISTSINN